MECFLLDCILGALICTIIGFFISQQNAFININKLFLVGILFFIIPRSNRLSQLLRFASASLPTLLSLSFTWGVVFLMFAIALNQIFGVTKIGPNGTDNLNLRSVPKALTLLFRCSFGEGWNYVMVDYALQEPFCTSTPDGITDCGNKQYAYILFITWNLTSMYIFLNMFVSLILDSFSYINNTSSYIKLIQRDELRSFKASWQKFDEEGTGYIKPIDLPKFLHSLDGALSFHFYTGSLEIKLLCKEWFIRNNPFDPYDVTVKHDAINETLESLDIPKIRARRRIYEMFVEEALLTMELNNSPGISFTLLLLQLPLYIAFDSGTCLNLIDFLERRLLLQKVEKRLKIKRVYDIMTTYAVRWKYQKDKRLGIEDSNIEFGKKFRRNSYFENPDLMENKGPSVFVTDEDSQHSRQLHEPSPMKPNLNNPFKTEMNDMEGYNFNDGRNYHENVYEPASPVQLYKSTDMRNRLSSSPTKAAGVESDNHPSVLQLFVKLPQSAATSPNSGTPGFQNPVGIELTGADEQASNKSDASFIDIALLGEELQDTQWGEALRQVQSEHKSENSKEQ